MNRIDSVKPQSFCVQRNARDATAEDLIPLAFAGYAHFTALQVRSGGVRGLDLHLNRLRSASQSMFGQALLDETVRNAIRAGISASPSDCSLLATMYSSTGEFTAEATGKPPEILVRTMAPSSGPGGPLSLAVFEYERILPEIKHVGEVAKTWFMRQAAAQGFDDAAFVDRHGRFSEASIWNLVFWDGHAVVWPEAAMLRGTSMGIVMRQLERLGIPQRHQIVTQHTLSQFEGAAVMNSWTPGIAVRKLGAAVIPSAPDFIALLHKAYGAEPLLKP